MARVSMVRLAGVAGLCLGMAGLAPVAMAQSAKPKFDRKLGDEAALERRGQGRSNVTIMMSESDGDDTYVLKMSGDDVSAEINGEKVPQKRIKRHGNSVDILDKNGEVVHTFHTGGFGVAGGAGQGGRGLTLRLAPRTLEDFPQGGLATTIEHQHPPVMLGINLSEADGGGIMVDRVIPGLPAEQAGLKDGDVIVKIDGKDAEDSSALRKALADRKDGDTMEVVVKRGEEEKTFKIKLAEWSAEKLAPGQVSGEELPPSLTRWFGNQDNYAEARKALEKALEEIKASSGENAAKLKADAQAALQDALKAIEEAKVAGRQWWSQNRARILRDDNGQNLFVMPSPPTPAIPGESGDLQKQLEKMSRQMERLNQRVEQLQRQIEEQNAKRRE